MNSKTITTMTTKADNNSSIFVYHVEANDVLLGRGAPIIKNKGNQGFREVVNNRKAEYMASCRHSVKNNIAIEVIQTIISRNGRFLRKVEDGEEAHKLGVSYFDKSVWVIADEHVTLQKVKQALREQEATKTTQTTKKRVEVKSKVKVVSNKKSYSNESAKNKFEPPPASKKQIQELLSVQFADKTVTLSNDDLVLEQTQLELEKKLILGEILRRQIEFDTSKLYNTTLSPNFNIESSSDRVYAPKYSQGLGIVSPLVASLRFSQPNNLFPVMVTPTDIENVNVRDYLRLQRQLTSSSVVNDRGALLIPSLDAANEY